MKIKNQNQNHVRTEQNNTQHCHCDLKTNNNKNKIKAVAIKSNPQKPRLKEIMCVHMKKRREATNVALSNNIGSE